MPDSSRFVEIDVSEPRAYFRSLWERSEVRVRSIATGSLKRNVSTNPADRKFRVEPVATLAVQT